MQEPEFAKFYLFPAALYAERTPTLVTTVLGTCVAICLYDFRLKKGGINHYMLPLWNGDGLASPKYGNISIERLLDSMESMGCRRKNLIAKVFGGKSMTSDQPSILQIGERNAHVAQKMLTDFRIPIQATSLGGHHGRKILFNTYTGQVMMKYTSKD
ncbi:MAG: chemotaxis protein CheD [Cyclobacteriaceae bacterium]